MELRNPFWIRAQPEGLQSTGWLGALKAVASTRGIAAESAQDLAAGVRFAREHKIRLVVKGRVDPANQFRVHNGIGNLQA